MDVHAGFWEEAVRRGLPRFRFLRRPVPPEQLDAEFRGTRLEQEWDHLRAQMRAGD